MRSESTNWRSASDAAIPSSDRYTRPNRLFLSIHVRSHDVPNVKRRPWRWPMSAIACSCCVRGGLPLVSTTKTMKILGSKVAFHQSTRAVSKRSFSSFSPLLVFFFLLLVLLNVCSQSHFVAFEGETIVRKHGTCSESELRSVLPYLIHMVV